MNSKDRAILYGLAIGDGHISLRNRLTKDANGVPKYSYVACELVIGHSTLQSAYIEHKRQLLVSIFGGSPPKITACQNRIGEKVYKTLRIAKSDTYFRQMHRVLYPNGRKEFSRQALNYMDAHSVALWFMDDGSMRCNLNNRGEVTSLFADICTQCSEPEAELIKDWFDYYWGIESKLRPSKGRFNIGFNTKSCHKLADLVWKYLHPSMEYKFRHLHDFVLRKSARHPTFNMEGDDIVRPCGKAEPQEVGDKEPLR